MTTGEVQVSVDEAARLIDRIRRCVIGSADLGLDASRLVIDPVVNWGGFVNRSFRLADGRSTMLLKLASTADARSDLERWRQLADVLTHRYRAPRMIGWVDVSASSGGPIFDWIEGTSPTRVASAPIPAIASLLHDLHADDQLARSLERLGDRAGTCADAYRQCYHRRFMEDLDGIRPAPPPFVDSSTLQWLQNEASVLESRIAASVAFAEPADRPIHGDLWLNNLLVRGPDDWHLLDWDGITLGDPVMDWAMLFGPSREEVRIDPHAAASVTRFDAAEVERLHAYARASLLDWIIDPLADWVQAGIEPFHGEAIRAGNERVHREALTAYRSQYADGGNA
jgi:aminoglycoside phosphotransferase (APT) family kinase protein